MVVLLAGHNILKCDYAALYDETGNEGWAAKPLRMEPSDSPYETTARPVVNPRTIHLDNCRTLLDGNADVEFYFDLDP
jgi:hypothetical protein